MKRDDIAPDWENELNSRMILITVGVIIGGLSVATIGSALTSVQPSMIEAKLGAGPVGHYCDLAQNSGTSADGKVSVYLTLYRPYCNAQVFLSVAVHATAGCRENGFSGHFNFNGAPVYLWVHEGDPNSVPTTGGNFPCDGGTYGVTPPTDEDCGVGSLVIDAAYGDYGSTTSAATAAIPNWVTTSPCLPNERTADPLARPGP